MSAMQVRLTLPHPEPGAPPLGEVSVTIDVPVEAGAAVLTILEKYGYDCRDLRDLWRSVVEARIAAAEQREEK